MPITTSQGAVHAANQTFAYELLRELVTSNVMSKEQASQFALRLAETMRSMEAVGEAQGMVNILARQYEDMASMLLGGGLLPR